MKTTSSLHARIVYALLSRLAILFSQMEQQQQTLFQEMGQTRSERYELSCLLAAQLYACGQGTHLPAAVLQGMMREGDVQAFLLVLLSGGPAPQTVQAFVPHLLRSGDYVTYVSTHTSLLTTLFLGDATGVSPVPPVERDAVSRVRPASAEPGGRGGGPAASRAARRTGRRRGERSRVSESRLRS